MSFKKVAKDAPDVKSKVKRTRFKEEFSDTNV
jgi:hypothetical protein